ncbi:MAG: DNA-binding protein YbiB [Betaproteobacteria bacterium]|nr:DNA-binding protein YbiB [Betaproteobacteria bacterium]
MSLTRVIKQLAGETSGARELGQREAHALMSAMLDGGTDEIELGALLALLEGKPVTLAELLGYCDALAQRCSRLRPPAGSSRPVVFACYHGVRRQPHLLPLVALVLQRLNVPVLVQVLVHGALDGAGGIAAARVFRELDVFPCASLSLAQSRIEERRLAFVPTGVLAPGLAELLALRGRLGFGGFIQALASLMAPFGTEALHVVAIDPMLGHALLREYLAASGSRALLLEGVEGEGFADSRRRPQLEYVTPEACAVLFDAETATLGHSTALPAAVDARTVAAWIRRAIAGEVPLPLPLVNQIACCLYGAGHAEDMNRAKAIVAVVTGSLAAA